MSNVICQSTIYLISEWSVVVVAGQRWSQRVNMSIICLRSIFPSSCTTTSAKMDSATVCILYTTVCCVCVCVCVCVL